MTDVDISTTTQTDPSSPPTTTTLPNGPDPSPASPSPGPTLKRAKTSPGVIREADGAYAGTVHPMTWGHTFDTLPSQTLRAQAFALAAGVVRVFAQYESSSSSCSSYPCTTKSTLSGTGAVLAVLPVTGGSGQTGNDVEGMVDVYVVTNNHVVPSKSSGLRLKRISFTWGIYAPLARATPTSPLAAYPTCIKLSSHAKIVEYLGPESTDKDLDRAADLAFLRCSLPAFVAAAHLAPLTPHAADSDGGGEDVGDDVVAVGYPGSRVSGYAYDALFEAFHMTAAMGPSRPSPEPGVIAHAAPVKKGMSGMPLAFTSSPSSAFAGIHRGRIEGGDDDESESVPHLNAAIRVSAPTFACGFLRYVANPIVSSSTTDYTVSSKAAFVSRLSSWVSSTRDSVDSCSKLFKTYAKSASAAAIKAERSEDL